MKAGRRLLSIGAHLRPQVDLWRYSRQLMPTRSAEAVALRSYLFAHSLEVLDENHVLVAASERKHAGILVPVYEDERGELRVLLTERSAELNSHAGEVSFPGGKTDEGEDDLDAAVREGAWGERTNRFRLTIRASGGGNWADDGQPGGAGLHPGHAVQEGPDLLSLCGPGGL